MVFIYIERCESSTAGTRLVNVSCDQCGCAYCYELARVGTGATSTLYGIGQERATRKAEFLAQQDLARRLEEEDELVPCPKCGWINESMVAGYRRGRYRGWSVASASCGLIGASTSLVIAWFLSRGPGADPGASSTVLTFGISLSATFAILILLGRRWLRSRIRPNRDYPLAPTVPIGSPTPLMANPVTGQLEPVTPNPEPIEKGSHTIIFQVGRHEMPPICCECLQPAQFQDPEVKPLFPGVELGITLCDDCTRTLRRRKWRASLFPAGLTLAIGTLVLLALCPDWDIFWILFVVLCGLAPIVGATIAYERTKPVHVKVADASRGIFQLRFGNPKYRDRVESFNQIDTSELQQRV